MGIDLHHHQQQTTNAETYTCSAHKARQDAPMKRRDSGSGFPFGPTLLVGAAVTIIIFWNLTTAPDSQSRIQGDFTILTGVRLIEDRANDGDSFRIQHRNKVETYRLYFVDTCETTNRFTKRLGHQARYFGGLTIPQVLKLGHEARETTLDWLRHQPSEIHTRGESVMNSHRLHAMVRFPKAIGTDREWLSQRLINLGLARIYTRGSHLADGTSYHQFKSELTSLEKRAKTNNQGAWSLKP